MRIEFDTDDKDIKKLIEEADVNFAFIDEIRYECPDGNSGCTLLLMQREILCGSLLRFLLLWGNSYCQKVKGETR